MVTTGRTTAALTAALMSGALLVALAVLPHAGIVLAQQPCNPIVDGTYCATQGGKPRTSSGGGSANSLPPIGSIADDLFPGDDRPGTLGAITFQGYGTRCIGLMRQSKCN